MNERIKELAEQSQKVVGHTDGGYTEIKALDQEKFAKLIIEECGRALNPMLRDMVSRGRAAELIKEHFGVKE